MPRLQKRPYEVGDLHQLERLEGNVREEVAAHRKVMDQVKLQFAIVEGSNNIVRCKTCHISIKNKLSVKKKHLESRSHLHLRDAQANLADSTVPNHLATDDSTISDPSPMEVDEDVMEVDLETLGVYNPSTQTSAPANGLNLFYYLREQAERARLQAEAEELDGRKRDEETFEWEQPPPMTTHAPPRQNEKDDPNWFPFPNRKTALCAILMTMPRHPLSNAVLKMIWWWAGQLGLVLPPIDAIKKLLAKLHTKTGGQVDEHKSINGTPFYMNDVSCIVAQEVANPIVMQHLQCYTAKVSTVGAM